MRRLEDQIPQFDRGFDALEQGDLDAFMEVTRRLADPECELHSGIGSAVGGGSYQGVEAIRGWFGDLIESTSERHWRNRRYETRGDTLLLFLADFEFIGAASGARVQDKNGAVFEFQDGLCVRMNSFMSHAEAREFAEARVA
jgi:ketosteroid isomerase-like protein